MRSRRRIAHRPPRREPREPHTTLRCNGFRKEERAAAADVTRGAGASVQEVAALAADISLKSPISAEVDKIVLHQGELAPPGFPIISLVNLDDVWAVFNLREDELADIKIDTKISGKVPALGNRVVTFSVYYISPKGEYATWRATRQSSGYDIKTFEVRARPVEKVNGLRPGMSVLVDRAGISVGRRPELIQCFLRAFVPRVRAKSPISARIRGIWR